jgi:hypothetical protein
MLTEALEDYEAHCLGCARCRAYREIRVGQRCATGLQLNERAMATLFVTLPERGAA